MTKIYLSEKKKKKVYRNCYKEKKLGIVIIMVNYYDKKSYCL